ncbi:MAG TPA: aminodeoxychorismate/anthranilate synthase component II [Gemmatimonadales bacterium]|nr:aminodeoxychorismate/anthranilate synthase component II [Gemmatimonadales bacterium]
MPERPYVLFVDNHDSFTFNLVDQLAKAGAATDVVRNDAGSDAILARAVANACRLIVISPGPGTPGDAGCCLELIHAASDRIPIFGVCLGHQAIVEAFGGEVGPAPSIVHGKASRIRHAGHPLFAGLPESLQVGRYHSLAARRIPDQLEVIARDDEVAMAVAHRTLPVYGVQFHPESILTPSGPRLLGNLFELALRSARA